ncbi:anti-sigma factor family protein [Streptomyces sp. NPDC048527]|uniref:anti-sigma factor family protein n=1 Tax=Streptomyces sp. NPDC048527 TaxID=3365568 RepID=UPI003713E4C5
MKFPDRQGTDSDIHVDIGLYAVGALDPGQAAEFEGHLVGCERCTDELAGFQDLVRLLASLADEVSDEGGQAGERQGAVVRMDTFRSRRQSLSGVVKPS